MRKACIHNNTPQFINDNIRSPREYERIKAYAVMRQIIRITDSYVFTKTATGVYVMGAYT